MEAFILKLVIVYSTCFGLLYLSPCIFNLSCPILTWLTQPGLRPGLPLITCERNWARHRVTNWVGLRERSSSQCSWIYKTFSRALFSLIHPFSAFVPRLLKRTVKSSYAVNRSDSAPASLRSATKIPNQWQKIFIALLEIPDLAREAVSAIHGSRCIGVEGFVLEKSLLLLPSCNLFVHPLLKATVIQSDEPDNYFTYFISSLSY
jgi:hypothetical protein